MKKIVAMLMVCAMVLSLCACTSTKEESKEAIGYVIVPHSDGDEHIAIYKSYANNGIVWAWCVDGRVVKGTTLIVVENN